MRINKLLSNYGYCSRKEANEWIAQGRVVVDGNPCTMGQWVEPEQDIFIDGRPAEALPRQYLKYHKPVGVLSTMDGRADSLDQVLKLPFYAFPVGRLDKDSEGLLFLTNDGDLANWMIAKDNHCEKTYRVMVNQSLTAVFLNKLSTGVLLGTQRTLACQVRAVGEREFEIVLRQGLNRQIRRMCTALGYRVERLIRVQFGTVTLGELPSGQWSALTKAELNELMSDLER